MRDALLRDFLQDELRIGVRAVEAKFSWSLRSKSMQSSSTNDECLFKIGEPLAFFTIGDRNFADTRVLVFVGEEYT